MVGGVAVDGGGKGGGDVIFNSILDRHDLPPYLSPSDTLGSTGPSADNALAESFNATLKRELLADAKAFPDQATAYRAVFRWANRYNTRRRHSAIGNLSP